MIFGLARGPPFFRLEDFPETIGNCRIVFVAGYFFGQRTGQANDVIRCDAPLLRVKLRQFCRVGGRFVVNDYGEHRERRLGGRGLSRQQERHDQRGKNARELRVEG